MTMKKPGIARFAAFDGSSPDETSVIEKMEQPKATPKRSRRTIRVEAQADDTEQLSLGTSATVNLADPAEVAMLSARYDALNDSLHRIARDRAQDELRFKIEKSDLERALAKKIEELETAEQEIADLKKELSHAKDLVEAVKGSAPYQAGKLVKLFLLTLVVSSAAAIAFTIFTL